jgi:hypothetical protein
MSCNTSCNSKSDYEKTPWCTCYGTGLCWGCIIDELIKKHLGEFCFAYLRNHLEKEKNSD